MIVEVATGRPRTSRDFDIGGRGGSSRRDDRGGTSAFFHVGLTATRAAGVLLQDTGIQPALLSAQRSVLGPCSVHALSAVHAPPLCAGLIQPPAAMFTLLSGT